MSENYREVWSWIHDFRSCRVVASATFRPEIDVLIKAVAGDGDFAWKNAGRAG